MGSRHERLECFAMWPPRRPGPTARASCGHRDVAARTCRASPDRAEALYHNEIKGVQVKEALVRLVGAARFRNNARHETTYRFRCITDSLPRLSRPRRHQAPAVVCGSHGAAA